jgi:hypothetical protein
MARDVSAKSTKTEILDAYEELVSEHQTLQAQLEELRAGQHTVAPRAPQVIEAKPLTEMVKGATVHEVLQGLSALRTGFGSACSALSAQLTTEVTRLAALRSDIATQTSELQALHGLEVTAQTLAELLQKYTEAAERFDTDMQQQRQAFEREMAERRAAWQQEQETQTRFLRERDTSLRRRREREAAEYAYARERTRKQDTDTYAQQQKTLYAALDEFVQSKQRDWQARESAIAEQERLFAEYKAKVEAFPAELEAAVQKATTEGRRLVETDAKVQADLQAQDIAGERRISELRSKALRDTIDKQAQQIDQLARQLSAVLQQAQDLAVKALEGTSTSGSYQAMREIALEQAKNLQKNAGR